MIGLQRWQSLAEAFNGRALRERAIICISLLAFFYFVGEQVIYNNFEKEISKKEQDITVKQGLLIALQQETAVMKAEYEKDSEVANRARLVELESRLNDVENSLIKLRDEIVMPSEIAHIVENVLSENRRLNVIAMENLEPIGIDETVNSESEDADQEYVATNNVEEVEKENTKKEGVSIYKHGIRIVVDGHYHDLVHFLSALEKLPKKVLWGEADLKSIEYPVSELSVLLYTLSFDQAWLKV